MPADQIRPDPVLAVLGDAAALTRLPGTVLEGLHEAIRAELARRDVEALVVALQQHFTESCPDPEVRELVADHGPATTVLFSAEEWDTGHLLGTDADVTFADGEVENVDLRALQDLLLAVSAVHAPVGYAAEYRVDLRAGAGVFAPIGFGALFYPRSAQEEDAFGAPGGERFIA
jgi:hypothetical protein